MKNALITGVSKGIGNAIARKLVGEGYFIHGTFNASKEEAEKLKEELKNIELYRVNFESREEVVQFTQKVKTVKFDAIVNNSGIILFEQFEDLSLETWDKLLAVNLTAPFIICHELRNSIQAGGAIVNIVSTDGLTGTFNSVPYSVSKAGLINLTKSLANILGEKNVRVNSIAPRWVGSGMNSPAYDVALKMTPLKRLASYEEVADVVVYLLSSKSSFINGENIVVDGGYANVDSIMKKESEAT